MDRPKPKYIQVQYTREVPVGTIARCAPAHADNVSVYEGQHGAFRWLADFCVYDVGVNDALNWAKARAMRLGAELLDDTRMQ